MLQSERGHTSDRMVEFFAGLTRASAYLLSVAEALLLEVGHEAREGGVPAGQRQDEVDRLAAHARLVARLVLGGAAVAAQEGRQRVAEAQQAALEGLAEGGARRAAALAVVLGQRLLGRLLGVAADLLALQRLADLQPCVEVQRMMSALPATA